MSTLANSCCEPQLLSLNNSSGYLSISSGNQVYLGTIIKQLGITTPVIAFQLNGFIVTLTYTDSGGIIRYKEIDLSALAQGGSFTVLNTPSIDLTYASAVLSANTNISTHSGNSLVINSDGLYVPTFSQVSIIANDSSTIDFTTSAISTFTGSVKVSANTGNKLLVEGDGLYVGDMTTYILSGTNVTITGSGSATSPYIIAASNASQTPLSVNDSSTFHFQTSGTLGMTLTGNVKISSASNNAIIANADGLYVPQSTSTSYTDAQARAAISAIAPLLYNDITGVMSISQATSLVSGYLTNSDWVNFNGKISTGQSLGSSSSVPVYAGQAGTTLNFNGLRAGTNISMTQAGNDIIISSAGGSGGAAQVFVIDFIIGDGGPLTPTANSSTFSPSSNPLVGKTVLGFWQEGTKIAPVVRTGGVLYYTFNSVSGAISLTNGVFSSDTYYSIIYR